jgi:excisionase family DNA binding protein
MFEDTSAALSGFVSVAQAARRLGVTESRVRQLIHARELRAQRVQGLWLLPVEEIERREDLAPGRGRRLTAARAWGLLYLAAGLPAPWLNRSARYRLRSLLKERGLKSLRSQLTARGVPTPMRSHPSLLPKLREEPALMLTGATAAMELRLGLLAHDVVEGYVEADRVDDVVGRYHLRASRNPNVVLRVVPQFTSDWPLAHEAPLPAIALDLLEDADPRAREVGEVLIERIGR